MTIASNIPNLLRASVTESPYCFSVIGISASFVLLSADVRQLPNIIGNANDMYFPNETDALLLYFSFLVTKFTVRNITDAIFPHIIPRTIIIQTAPSSNDFAVSVEITITADFTAKSIRSETAVTPTLLNALKYPRNTAQNAPIGNAYAISFTGAAIISLLKNFTLSQSAVPTRKIPTTPLRIAQNATA